MPDTGPPWTIPYSAPTDPPDGPAQSKVRAERIAANLTTVSAGPAGQWSAGRYGFLGWSTNIDGVRNSGIPSNGILNGVRVRLSALTPISTIVVHVQVAGSNLTAGQNFAGIYSTAGALLGQTADMTTVWNTTGVKDMPLTASVTPPGNEIYVVVLARSSTSANPQIAQSSNSSPGVLLNYGMTVTNLRCFQNASGSYTTLPATLPTLQGYSNMALYWAAVK